MNPHDRIADLLAFLAVARERSFTRAAAKLGVSQSALSHTVRSLEAKLGLRLLNRTTRSVSPTEAGERLLLSVGPRFEEIEAELAALTELRHKPAGNLRITCGEHAADSILWPALCKFLPQYPDIKVEVTVDYGFVDIVAQRYDAGIRFREAIEEDMIAIPIGPEMRMAAVASPEYFARHAPPKTPHELSEHNCINMRMPTYGGFYIWEFEKDGRELRLRVDGQLAFNGSYQILNAALAGYGIAYLPQDMMPEYLAAGRLKRVLEDWCPPFPGYQDRKSVV